MISRVVSFHTIENATDSNNEENNNEDNNNKSTNYNDTIDEWCRPVLVNNDVWPIHHLWSRFHEVDENLWERRNPDIDDEWLPAAGIDENFNFDEIDFVALDQDQWEFLFDAMGPYRNHIPYEGWLPNHPYIAWRMAEMDLLMNDETTAGSRWTPVFYSWIIE